MKRILLLPLLLLAMVFTLAAPRPAHADVTFSWFYDSLAPYGEWVELDGYGYCWMPRETLPGPKGEPSDWRPYTDGYWSYTDAGWTWVSYEDFGDIVYHYGRWLYLEGDGWAWVPDYEWGPAWVSWQQDDEYIGWAPLPPEAEFDDETGIGEWADRDYDIGPEFYTFCEVVYFGEPVLRPHLRPWRENVVILGRTHNVTNITYVMIDNRRVVFNGGLDFAFVSRHSRRPLERLRLRRQFDGDWADHARPERSRREGNLLYINAPVVSGQRLGARIDFAKTRPGRGHGGPAFTPPKANTPPRHGNARPPVPVPPPKVARQIRQPKVDTGWRGADAAQREQFRQRTLRQTEGKTRANAPARKVDERHVQTLLNEPRPAPAGPPAAPGPRPVDRPERGQRPSPLMRPQATPALPPSQPSVRPEMRPENRPENRPQPQSPKPQPPGLPAGQPGRPDRSADRREQLDQARTRQIQDAEAQTRRQQQQAAQAQQQAHARQQQAAQAQEQARQQRQAAQDQARQQQQQARDAQEAARRTRPSQTPEASAPGSPKQETAPHRGRMGRPSR